jgi:recombination protein RecT
MDNNNAPAPLTAKTLFARDDVKAKFQELLGKRSTSFITSVLQIVASNDLLAKADPSSIYQSAAVAATLELPLNNQLGFAYIVPYNESFQVDGQWKKRVVAQFQIGYKGYKQLALRSGQFLTIHATDVREGEIIARDRLTGKIDFKWEEDEEIRNSLKIIGYVSYFELLNGFSQTFYMTVGKIHEHAKKYSQTFKNDKGRWKDDFDGMSLKTVTKLNLSKNAPLSVEMQKALIADQAIIKDADTLDVTYADNDLSALGEPVTYADLMALVEEKEPLMTKQKFEDAKRILGNKEEESYKKLYQDLLNLKEVDNGVQ